MEDISLTLGIRVAMQISIPSSDQLLFDNLSKR